MACTILIKIKGCHAYMKYHSYISVQINILFFIFLRCYILTPSTHVESLKDGLATMSVVSRGTPVSSTNKTDHHDITLIDGGHRVRNIMVV